MELFVDELGVVVAVLGFEGGAEAEERAGIARIAGEVIAKDFFSAGGVTGLEQDCAEGFADGEEPVGRLVVGERVLESDGAAEKCDGASAVVLSDGDFCGEIVFGDFHDFCGLVGSATVGRVGWNFAVELHQGGVFGLGVFRFARSGESHAASVMPEAVDDGVRDLGLGQGENFGPFVEADIDGGLDDGEACKDGHFFEHGRDVRGKFGGGSVRVSVIAIHSAGDGDEVEIVAVIHHGIGVVVAGDL